MKVLTGALQNPKEASSRRKKRTARRVKSEEKTKYHILTRICGI